jgi:N-acetylglucosamine-6-phosphate deacetylase
MRIRGRHYGSGQRIDVVTAGDKIESVDPAGDTPVDLEAGWVAPAFFDLQINGCGGRAFSSVDLSEKDVRAIMHDCRRHGIAQFLPTLITNSFAALAHGLTTLRRARESDDELARAIPGIHLEGPYISPEDGPRGAHPRSHVRPPDWDEFCRLQDAAGGLIRLVTLAPEVNGALAFIERATMAGIVIAIGHTASDRPRIRDAIQAGAKLSTHLGNGAHAVLPRHPNYIWEQLAADELWASIICDGHHLPPSVIQCLVRVKTPARIILTCDASCLAGLPAGRYTAWEQEFEVKPEGKIVVPGTQYLGGSWAFTDQCVRHLLNLGVATLPEAVDMAGARPRSLLGFHPRSLVPGQSADLILFDWSPADEWSLKATVVDGAIAKS